MPFKQWIFPTGETMGRKKRIEVWVEGDRVRATEYILPPNWAPLGAASFPLQAGSLSVEAVSGLLVEGYAEGDVARYIVERPSGGYMTAIAYWAGDGEIGTRWGGQILPAGAEPLAFGVLKDERITTYPMTITPSPEAEQAVSEALELLTFRGQRGVIATTIPAS